MPNPYGRATRHARIFCNHLGVIDPFVNIGKAGPCSRRRTKLEDSILSAFPLLLRGLQAILGNPLRPSVIARSEATWQSPTKRQRLSYFLSGEKVCKEPPGPSVWSRTPRRPKGKQNKEYNKPPIPLFPLWKPLVRFAYIVRTTNGAPTAHNDRIPVTPVVVV